MKNAFSYDFYTKQLFTYKNEFRSETEPDTKIGWYLPLIHQARVSSVSCFGVRFSVMFHFMFVHYTFSSVWVAEWPPFGK